MTTSPEGFSMIYRIHSQPRSQCDGWKRTLEGFNSWLLRWRSVRELRVGAHGCTEGEE